MCLWEGVQCELSCDSYGKCYPKKGGRVTRLDLGWNRLSGTLPPEIFEAGSLGELVRLDLAGNHPDLHGELPNTLSNLAKLEHLFLYHNDLSGSIPAQIGTLPDLTHIALYNNHLTGRVPRLSNSTLYFSAEGNELTSVEPGFCDLPDTLFETNGCRLRDNLFPCQGAEGLLANDCVTRWCGPECAQLEEERPFCGIE